jgi:dTDP-4-dehydrorhamnose reductase
VKSVAFRDESAMRALVTGGGGMLARAVVAELLRRGHEVDAPPRSELDIRDEAAFCARILQMEPDAVIQCAAYTAVDAAEEREDEAHRVNAEATAFAASACHKIGAALVYPSTDYVFSGESRKPYRPDDPTDPVNAYGRSKLAGEVAAREAGRWLVVRTSWLYGAGGRNFVDTIRALAGERERLEVVDDQVGRPTWTGTLAKAMVELVMRGAEGVVHVTDQGEPASWWGVAREIVAGVGARVEVTPVSSARFPRPARRPGYSVLDCSGAEGLLGEALPEWRGVLAGYLAS